jgi:Zn-dependent protease with chaperone function
MTHARMKIAPRRSLALFALLSILMVIASYVVIVLLAVACVVGPYFLATHSRNAQVWVLFLGGIVVAGTLLWSIVPRWEKFEAPGLPLERVEHPRLFAEIDDIAAALNEPLPKQVFLVGSANAFVSNVGGFFGIGGRRILGIGLPFLSMLTIPEFRAVLAHEFAHYYGGDTRLGPLVYRAQKSIILVFQNMGKIGVIGRIGILRMLHYAVTTTMEVYFRFFLRVINFISRRREFRADELACLVVGVAPMKAGLRKIHGGGMAWPTYWSSEIAPVLKQGCLPAIGKGFAQFLAAPQIALQVEQAIVKEIFQGKTEPFDTHPPLWQRLAAIEKLDTSSGQDESPLASELFEKPEALERQFLEFVDPRFREMGLRFVSWDEVGRTVLIPSWRELMAEHASLFQGVTVGSLPEVLRRLPQMTSQIPNPEGMLLSGDQRVQRGMYLMGVGLALTLVEHGWELDAEPGTFRIFRGAEDLNPYQAVQALIDGKTSAQEWEKRCAELGIEELSLGAGHVINTAEIVQGVK